METKKQNVTFENCNKVGDNIKALVKYFTMNTLGVFILEKALEEVKENNAKIEEFKKTLL